MTRGERIAMRIGIAILIVAYMAAYAVTQDRGWAFIVTCIVLAILPTTVDPAILIKQAQTRPTCFGDFRYGQSAAERDCNTCPHFGECFDHTAWKERSR